MKQCTRTCALALAGVLSLGAQAATQDVSSTVHAVVVDDGEAITTPDGGEVNIRTVSHGTIVNDTTGEILSQWCFGEESPTDEGPVGAGYCTIIADNGDVLWISYLLQGGEPSIWRAMGGTGQYQGATGEGTTTFVSERGDGEAWSSHSTGTLTTR